MADVNDKGEVTVEGQFVGKLEGFRFRMDQAASADEAKTLRAASVAALLPHFTLRADRFYNAPDTEIDFTEQGGLMWGENAVGKLVAGPDPLKPQVAAFVDDEAGDDVATKVQRRLQHFIDRKIAALFEPLLALGKDEALTGLAKGFAFRMVEGFGILPRGEVADEVKALDQEARGALRKHGIRFGQFTVFQQALLKPAPTRLRLVLWSLAKGLQEFPEAPPPGLVTVPTIDGLPPGTYAMAGYRAAGARAVRIDMLERLADMIREKDTKAGFEATADMLSITGLSHDQFSELMVGLGYKSEKGERIKVKAAKVEAPAPVTDEGPRNPIPEGESVDKAPEEAVAEDAAPEMETFYTFTWGGRPDRPRRERPEGGRGRGQSQGQGQLRGERRAEGQGDKPRQDRGERGEGHRGKGPKGGKGKKHDRRDRDDEGGKTFEARPPREDRREKKIDPDNPFAAALAGLKIK